MTLKSPQVLSLFDLTTAADSTDDGTKTDELQVLSEAVATLLNSPLQSMVLGANKSAVEKAKVSVERDATLTATGWVLVEAKYRCEKAVLLKLLNKGYYVEQKSAILLPDKFWVKPAPSWGQWVAAQPGYPKVIDRTGYSPNWQVVGWLFGGVRLLIRTVSNQSSKHGLYKLVRFERARRHRQLVELARADPDFDFGSLNPYEVINTELTFDPANEAAWRKWFQEVVRPLNFLETEASQAKRQRYTLFNHLKTRER